MNLVNQLKEAGQDHEFYPTTNEIIAAFVRDVKAQRGCHRHGRRSIDSALDIGAGHGKVLRALRDGAEIGTLYAIEKSPILCQQLDDEIFIVGTELHEQSLVAKQADITFCNPPYSEFEEWATKIIRESASWFVYLVIPQRWGISAEIENALKFRDAKVRVIGDFDFLDAEDRAARAKVHLIRIELASERDDAFDRFFEEQFADLKAKWDAEQGEKKRTDCTDETRRRMESDRRNPKFNSLVVGANYPDMLVGLYNDELDHVRKNYDLVKALDVDLLKEFDVSPLRIMTCMKARLAGLRNTYWQELFSHMKSVTNRLTTKKRRMMLETLNRSGHVDFTVTNIHAVIMWALKNANSYINTQLLETFDAMVAKANVRNYKSNARVFTFDRWRYEQEKPTHIALEYRIVLERVGGLRARFSTGHELVESAAEFLGDLLTVAHCMGFTEAKDPVVVSAIDVLVERRKQAIADGEDVVDIDSELDSLRAKLIDTRLFYSGRTTLWEAGRREEFLCKIDGKVEVLFDVRAFQNGNMHIRLNQKFALAMNVEVGRLRGWIKSGAEAATELGDKTAAKYFGRNLQLGAGSVFAIAETAQATNTQAANDELFPA